MATGHRQRKMLGRRRVKAHKTQLAALQPPWFSQGFGSHPISGIVVDEFVFGVVVM